MKNKLSIGIILVIMMAGCVEKLDCSLHRDGRYKVSDSELGEYVIERKGAIQTEHGLKSGLKLEFDVEWLDECTYTLKLKEVIENPNDSPLANDLILKVEIIAVDDKSYTQRLSANLYEQVREIKMIRLE